MTTDLSKLTVNDWWGAITKALEDHNVKAVAALIGAMAIHHPHEAENIRQTLLLGVSITAGRDFTTPRSSDE